MANNSSVVKATAKTALKGKWFKAAICSFMPIILYFIIIYIVAVLNLVISNVANLLVFPLLCFFGLFPITLGVLRYFWRMLNSADDELVSVFYFFSSSKIYLNFLKNTFYVTLRLVLIAFFCFIPAMLTDLFLGSEIYVFFNIPIPTIISHSWVISSAVKILSAVVFVFIVGRYYLVPFLTVADENMDLSEAMHISSVISKSSFSDFILLVFGFIGWMVLSIFLVPLVFTLPYMLSAYLIHSRFAVAEYNISIEKSNPYGTDELFANM